MSTILGDWRAVVSVCRSCRHTPEEGHASHCQYLLEASQRWQVQRSSAPIIKHKPEPRSYKKTCTYCDGCGWVEGGPLALQTKCDWCQGTGIERIETSVYHWVLSVLGGIPSASRRAVVLSQALSHFTGD